MLRYSRLCYSFFALAFLINLEAKKPKTAMVQEAFKKALNFDMSHIRKRYMKDHKASTKDAEECEIELKKYLALCAAVRNLTMFSSKVDDFWHTFIMFTKDYAKFCNLIAGKFLHHVPFNEDDQKNRTPKAVYNDQTKFINAYYKAFGANPRSDIWYISSSKPNPIKHTIDTCEASRCKSAECDARFADHSSCSQGFDGNGGDCHD